MFVINKTKLIAFTGGMANVKRSYLVEDSISYIFFLFTTTASMLIERLRFFTWVISRVNL